MRARVSWLQVFAQTLADFTQQLVAHMVTEGVVDRRAVQVDEHQREATALLLYRLDRVFNTVGEQGAIGQAEEWPQARWVSSWLAWERESAARRYALSRRASSSEVNSAMASTARVDTSTRLSRPLPLNR